MMSENSQMNERVRGQVDIIEDNSFSYDDFQVVRGEFFAHVFEPSITFVDSKVYVNAACIKKITDTDYAQILISKEQKKLLVRPCSEDERDSFRWCSATAKRSPKQVTCRPLFAILCMEMNWDPDYRYRFVGKLIRSNGELLFLFDLTSPEIFLREVSDDGKVKNSRKPYKKALKKLGKERYSRFMINAEDDLANYIIFNTAKSAKYIDENYGYFIWGISNNTHEIVGTNYNYHFKKIKIYCQKNKVLKKRKEILKKTEMNVIFKGFYLI